MPTRLSRQQSVEDSGPNIIAAACMPPFDQPIVRIDSTPFEFSVTATDNVATDNLVARLLAQPGQKLEFHGDIPLAPVSTNSFGLTEFSGSFQPTDWCGTFAGGASAPSTFEVEIVVSNTAFPSNTATGTDQDDVIAWRITCPAQ